MLKHILTACALFVLSGPLLAQPSSLSSEEKRALVDQLNAILSAKAFTSTVDFLNGQPKIAVTDEKLNTAQSNAAFAKVVNQRLTRYGVSHLELLTPEDVKEMNEGRLIGPGVATKRTPDGLVVHEVMPGSAAEAAGLHSRDILVFVNGKPPSSGTTWRLPRGRRKPSDTGGAAACIPPR